MTSIRFTTASGPVPIFETLGALIPQGAPGQYAAINQPHRRFVEGHAQALTAGVPGDLFYPLGPLVHETLRDERSALDYADLVALALAIYHGFVSDGCEVMLQGTETLFQDAPFGEKVKEGLGARGSSPLSRHLVHLRGPANRILRYPAAWEVFWTPQALLRGRVRLVEFDESGETVSLYLPPPTLWGEILAQNQKGNGAPDEDRISVVPVMDATSDQVDSMRGRGEHPVGIHLGNVYSNDVQRTVSPFLFWGHDLFYHATVMSLRRKGERPWITCLGKGILQFTSSDDYPILHQFGEKVLADYAALNISSEGRPYFVVTDFDEAMAWIAGYVHDDTFYGPSGRRREEPSAERLRQNDTLFRQLKDYLTQSFPPSEELNRRLGVIDKSQAAWRGGGTALLPYLQRGFPSPRPPGLVAYLKRTPGSE